MSDIDVCNTVIAMILAALICLPIFMADLSFLDKPKRRK